MGSKYYVICSGGVGGAEKRFSDIFMAQRELGFDVYYVAPTCLIEKVFTSKDILLFGDHIIKIKMEKWNPLFFLLKYFYWFVFTSNKRFTFHYPLNPLFFIHLVFKSRFVVSLCDCKRIPATLESRILGVLEFGGVIFAGAIDILSPSIFDIVVNRFPGRNIKLTPGGTFVRCVDFRNVVAPSESLTVGFVARLIPGKGVDLFIDVVRNLSFFSKDISRFNFLIFGDGPLSEFVKSSVFELKKKGVRIKYEGYVDSNDIVPKVDIICSLQDGTNFPSRVVPEALLGGCGVIVSDTGDSRSFGKLYGLNYLDHDANSIAGFLESFDKRVNLTPSDRRRISESARLRFSSKKYLDYFYLL